MADSGNIGRVRRPQYLFSGLTKCGVCGSGFIMAGADRLSCFGARYKGICDNGLTIRRDEVEARVLKSLQEKLLNQELFEEYCKEFTREMNRLGETFPVLCWIDRTWAANRVDAIFPTADDHRQLLEAAWTTYVKFQRPYTDIWELLVHLYEKAVRELKPVDRKHVEHDSYDQHLAMHVMAFFWYGVPRASELGRQLFENTDAALRRAALEFIGQSLDAEASAPWEPTSLNVYGTCGIGGFPNASRISRQRSECASSKRVLQ